MTLAFLRWQIGSSLEDGRVVADKTPNLAHIGRPKITSFGGDMDPIPNFDRE
jgi:hypothetical protein